MLYINYFLITHRIYYLHKQYLANYILLGFNQSAIYATNTMEPNRVK